MQDMSYLDMVVSGKEACLENCWYPRNYILHSIFCTATFHITSMTLKFVEEATSI
jgi:hypothetical protein